MRASDLDAFGRLAKAEHAVSKPGSALGRTIRRTSFRPAISAAKPLIPMRAKQSEWFDRWLKKPATPRAEADTAALHIFVMGPDVWRKEREWPLGAHALHAALSGQWRPRQHRLRRWRSHLATSPQIEGRYLYLRPARPRCPPPAAPSVANPILFRPARSIKAPWKTPGCARLHFATASRRNRSDGPVRTVLYVSTSANDTDFTAKLVDVQPDGKAAACDRWHPAPALSSIAQQPRVS